MLHAIKSLFGKYKSRGKLTVFLNINIRGTKQILMRIESDVTKVKTY